LKPEFLQKNKQTKKTKKNPKKQQQKNSNGRGRGPLYLKIIITEINNNNNNNENDARCDNSKFTNDENMPCYCIITPCAISLITPHKKKKSFKLRFFFWCKIESEIDFII
jgi:hypothetical protein